MFLLTGAFLYSKKRFQSSLYVSLFIFLTISAMGYLFVALSKSVDEALTATKISYIGAQFVPIVMLLILSKFVKFKYHNILLAICVTLAVVFFFITTLSISYSDLYYKSVELRQEYGVSYLVKVYGPLHIFAIAYSILFMVLMVSFFIFAFVKTRQISYKNSIILVTVVVVTTLFSYLPKILPSSFDIVPLSYTKAKTLHTAEHSLHHIHQWI